MSWFARLKHGLLAPRAIDAGAAGLSVRRWLNAPGLNAAWMKRQIRMHLAWPGLLGLGLIAAYLVFYLAVIVPTKATLVTTRQSAQTLQHKVQSGTLATEQQQLPEAQLARLYRALPAEHSLPEWLKRLFTLAEKQKIELDEGEYAAVRSKQGRLIRYQVTLPVVAEYPQIREYLAALRAEMPFLALEHVEFRREKIGEAEVEAKIKLVLFFVAEDA